MEKIKDILKKVLDFLKSLYARKVLFFTIVGAVAVLVGFLVFMKILAKQEKVVATAEQPVKKIVKNIFLDIPPGAFPSKKEFVITPLSDQDIEAIRKNVGPFVGEIYDIKPSDGKKEFAYIPIKMKFYFPADFYYGYDFNNVSLAYIPDDNPGVYKLFNGSTIGKDDRGYFVEAEVFHTSKVGVVAKTPKKQELGMKLIHESNSPKSAVLIVPGEDVNFSGYIGSLGTNIWESLFPDRMVFIYEYPLVDSRSMAYRDMVEEFFKSTGKRSYVEFEANRLARELKTHSNIDFNIIAHGIGGLIVRLAIEKNPDIKNVKKVVLVSTPNHGTNVPNPVYFSSLMYGKSFKALSEIFNMPEEEIKAVYLHVYNYIETVNTYWKDILPNSDVVKELERVGPRKDVQYISLVGTTPPLDINLEGNDLSKFYPELVKGDGDGVVSVESARLEGATNLKFEGSFFNYYTKSEVMDTIKSFIEEERIPKPPEFKSDVYREYVPKKEKEEGAEEEATRTRVERIEVVEKRKTREFKAPEGFVFSDILPDAGSMEISDYDSGECLDGKPYIATKKGLYIWDRILKGGSFQYLKKIDDNLTMICNDRTCLVNTIGFREIGKVENLDLKNIDDLIVMPDGRIIYTMRKETGVVDLMLNENGENKRLDFAPGFYGKIIPLPDGRLIFLTDSMITFVDREGKVLKKISSSSIAREGYSLSMRYAYEKDGYIFVLTKDYYLLVYDERSKRSWMMGEGWIGNRKIVDTGNGLVILGNRSINFVDVKNEELLKFIQIFDSEIVDGFTCEDKLYLVLKTGSNYTIKILDLGTGLM